MKITDRAIIAQVALDLDIDESDINDILSHYYIEIVERLVEGYPVVVKNFGRFEIVDRPNNFTGEGVFKTIKFKPSENLKRILPGASRL